MPPGRHVLGHPTAVREADGDGAVGELLDGGDGSLHKRGIPDLVGVSGRLVVVVEDPAVVLVDDHDLVSRGAQALGSVDHTGAHAEDGMEQGDLGHRSLLAWVVCTPYS